MVKVGDKVFAAPLYGQKDNLSVVETNNVKVGDSVFVAPFYGQKDNLCVIPTGTVKVGDTVHVVPLYGQKDNLAAIKAISEYTKWTYQWKFGVPDGVANMYRIAFFIDEKNDSFSLWWWDAVGSHDYRFGIYSLANHSIIFQSPASSNYVHYIPNTSETRRIVMGCGSSFNSISRTIKMYLLLQRADSKTFEVWHGATTPLFSRDCTLDGASYGFVIFEISPSGKYIMLLDATYNLLLYKAE